MRFSARGGLLIVALLVPAAVLGGCGGTPEKTVGGVGDTCAGDADCRSGLACRVGLCEPTGTSLAGDACQLTAECAAGLYCSAERECARAGDGAAGDSCATSADCAMGLVCASVRGELSCANAGTGDLGDACSDDLDCLAGLSCGDASGGMVCASGMTTRDGGTAGDGGERDGGVEQDAGQPYDAGPGPFPIGGNVSGLTSGSVEVTLNYTERLTLSANGPFTFATLVDRGATYAVDVSEQPATLRCTPSGGRGVAQAPVPYVAIDCNAGTPVATWEPVTPPPAAITRRFNDVWVADATHVYVVGPVNAVLSWNGTTFRMESLPTTGRTFYSVGGTDRSHIFVGGSSSLLLFYDGFRWTESTVGTAQTWQGMWVPEGRSASTAPFPVVTEWIPNTVAWMVSSGGRIARFDGSAWTIETSKVGDYLAIDGFDDGNVFIGRNVGRVMSGRAGAFTRGWDMGGPTTEYSGVTVFQSEYDDPLTDLVDESAYDAVVVGSTSDGAGVIVRCHVDNQPEFFDGPTPVVTWSAETPPVGTMALEDVWAASPDAIWAVGEGGTILKYDGTRWAAQTSGTTEPLRAVDGIDVANVWIVGDQGVILRGR